MDDLDDLISFFGGGVIILSSGAEGKWRVGCCCLLLDLAFADRCVVNGLDVQSIFLALGFANRVGEISGIVVVVMLEGGFQTDFVDVDVRLWFRRPRVRVKRSSCPFVTFLLLLELLVGEGVLVLNLVRDR